MRTVIGILLIMTVYILVYYRLLIRHYYEQATAKKESTFGAVFSLPPYKALPEASRKYVKRYWLTLLLMFSCIALAAVTGDFGFLKQLVS